MNIVRNKNKSFEVIKDREVLASFSDFIEAQKFMEKNGYKLEFNTKEKERMSGNLFVETLNGSYTSLFRKKL